MPDPVPCIYNSHSIFASFKGSVNEFLHDNGHDKQDYHQVKNSTNPVILR